MRLVATAPIPVLSLGVLSIAAGLTARDAPLESITPTADIALSVEPIKYREQVLVHREAPPPAPVTAHHSVWEGTYVCLQGLAHVKLTVDVDTQGVARARYDFGPVPSNPDIPKTGAFLLVGSLQFNDRGGFSGTLDARTWVSRPDDYFMVPLSITTTDGKHMTGRIHHETCSEFQTTRVK